MKFEEAFEVMKEGKRVRRQSWSSVSEYMMIDESDIVVVFSDGTIDKSMGNEIPNLSVNDLLATDWVKCTEFVDFLTAMKNVTQGLRARRRSWSGDHKERFVCRRGHQIHWINCGMTISCVTADDWYCYDEPN